MASPPLTPPVEARTLSFPSAVAPAAVTLAASVPSAGADVHLSVAPVVATPVVIPSKAPDLGISDARAQSNTNAESAEAAVQLNAQAADVSDEPKARKPRTW